MDVRTPADQLFFTTAFITGERGDRSWTGTGFIYAIEVGDDRLYPVLVSNKHVLEGADRLRFQMLRADAEGGPELGAPVRFGLEQPRVVGHPEPEVDVAVLPIGGLLEQLGTQGVHIYFKTVSPKVGLTAEREGELDALEEVVFVGYPSGIFDTANLTPVARRGMTATPIYLDYQGAPAFLVDAAVYPGSSGSPVFLMSAGPYTDRAGATVIGARLIFLGVLAAVHTTQVDGEVVHLPAQRTVRVNTPIGLGIVYKARTVHELATTALGDHERRPSSGPV